MAEIKICFFNYEERVREEYIVACLNEQSPGLCFKKIKDKDEADYVILIIGTETAGLPSLTEQDSFFLPELAETIVLVKKDVFHRYECEKRNAGSSGAAEQAGYHLIQMFDSEQKRKWIYTYLTENDVLEIVKAVLMSDSFTFTFDKQYIETEPEKPFQNMLLFRNNGHVNLEGYHIEGFYNHKMGKHRPKLLNFQPEIETVFPKDVLPIEMDFTAPDIAGSFIFYAVLKKQGGILKTEDTVASFVIHTAGGEKEKTCEAALLKESPENGKLFTDKANFTKKWTLKNNSGRDWPKVIFREKYDHFTHHFCREKEKVYTDILQGEVFELEANFYSPDISGNYTSYWHLLHEDGTEISVNGPLCCSVVTQYEMNPVFKLQEEERDTGILDRLKTAAKRLFRGM